MFYEGKNTKVFRRSITFAIALAVTSRSSSFEYTMSVHAGAERNVCNTVKSRLSERQLTETTGLFEDYGQSQLFSLLSIAIKLPIIQISIIRKIQFFKVIHRSRLKKLLLNYPSRFKVQMSRMVIMISLLGRVRFTHLSDLANKFAPGNWHWLMFTLLCDEPLS